MKKYFIIPILFILFQFLSLEASAAVSGGRVMTEQECLSMFGQFIPAYYYNGSDKVLTQFEYQNVRYCNYLASEDTYEYMAIGTQFLHYVANVPNLLATNYQFSVRINPTSSISNTTQIHSVIALSTGAYNPSTIPSISINAFTSPSWDWVFDDEEFHFENRDVRYNNASNLATARFGSSATTSGGYYTTFVPADLSCSSAATGYSIQATFYGNTSSDTDTIHLYIAFPYVDQSAVGSSVDPSNLPISTGSGSGSGSSVDMSETNGILGRIWNAIVSIPQNIIDGISDLFVPDEGFMDEQLEEMQNIFVWYEEITEAKDHVLLVLGQEQYNGDAPIVTLDTSQFVSSYTGGRYMSESPVIFDMSEFLPYAPIVRNVLRVFLWLFTIWRLFCRLPDIISGAGMAVQDGVSIESDIQKERKV